jgi:hypothetical protein
LNPWDYTQFLRKPLEDRKIGVPSVSATLSKGNWTHDVIWVPVLVPYRLAMPDERWAGISTAATIARTIPNAEITPQEPDLPDRTFWNGNFGLRVKRTGDIEWALNLFHGYDPRPLFKTTALSIISQGGNIIIDRAMCLLYRITSIGFDAAAVQGDLVSELGQPMPSTATRYPPQLWDINRTLLGVFPLIYRAAAQYVGLWHWSGLPAVRTGY